MFLQQIIMILTFNWMNVVRQLVAMSKRHRMLLIELAGLRMPDADVTRLHRAYLNHVEYMRQAYMDYCNGLQNAVYMCRHLYSCAPQFAMHVQVLK